MLLMTPDLHWLVSPMFWMTQASLASAPGLTNTASGSLRNLC